MIKIIVFCLLVASIAHALPVVKSETNSLEINTKTEDVEIKLPDVAFKALIQWNPEFIPFNRNAYIKSVLELFKDLGDNQVPMAFIEDLDGNGKKDIVLMGTDTKNQYAVALLQNDKKWTVLKLAQWANLKDTVTVTSTVKTASGTTPVKEIGVAIYVLKAIGEHAEKLKEKKKVGIQIETYLGPSDVYEIVNNKAVKFILPQSP